MCGILGFLSFGDRLSGPAFDFMLEAIDHRGPDASGKKSIRNGAVMLGHRRLAIVDLHPRGDQPLANETGSVWLTYNGEIYNHAELRRELEAAGHRFKTRTDSEVVVHAYEQWGPNCVQRFNGIFAFGLWDDDKQRLFLARDQMGVKPLYYAQTPGGFLFASQPKAILRCQDFPRRLSHEALLDYLAYGVVPDDRCVFEGIKKLRAARWIMIDRNGQSTEEKYWQPPELQENIDFEEAREETSRLVQAAVKSQLMSDVSIGTCLSGGIDSSLVNEVACRSSKEPIHSFTIGFPEHDLDERRYASVAAEAAGNIQHVQELNYGEFVDMLPMLIEAFDEPMYLSSAVSYFLLSKLAKQNGTKVLLSGDGGDELFAGYTRYGKLHGSDGVRAKDRLRAQYRRYRSIALREPPVDPWLDHFFRFEGVFDRTEIRSLAGPALEGAGEFDHTWRYACLDEPHLDPRARAQRLDFHSFLVDENLSRTDRAGMYFGVEVRVPMLDRSLVEFALSLPPKVQMTGDTCKLLLKSCAQDLIPRELITDRKRGFSAPFPKWIKTMLPELAPLALDGYLTSNGLLKRSTVRRIFKRRQRVAAWQILSLELWVRHWMAEESLPQLQQSWSPAAAKAA